MNDYSHKNLSLNVAKKVLEIKYKERQEQLELLTKSLTSSSRIARWISSTVVVVKNFYISVIKLKKFFKPSTLLFK